MVTTKYAVKTGNITQDTLLANVTHYLSNEVTVTSLILCNIITLSNEVTNLVRNPLNNAYSHYEVMKPTEWSLFISFLLTTKICTLSNNAIMSRDKVVVSHMTA